MHLSRLEIENYRVFGAKTDSEHVVIDLQPGLNLLLGENDSGKTCVIDAIRVLLGTNPPDYFTITPDDFHCVKGVRAKSLAIRAEFVDLNKQEAAAFLEYLTVAKSDGVSTYSLTLRLQAELDDNPARSSRRSPVKVEIRAGSDADGRRFEGPVRELLRATYLKPLRDAISELAPKKGSRLSQILFSNPDIRDHETCDWDPGQPNSAPQSITGVMRKAETEIRNSKPVQDAQRKLNDDYLKRFSLGASPVVGRIGVSAAELRHILERMELTLSDHEPGATRGLGLHNVLFMGAELLALERDNDPCLPLVLIEEPEAHLHPQLQLRLIEFFQKETAATGDDARNLQVLLTSHSPNIASKVGLNQITLMAGGQAFSLRTGQTALDPSDYEFLERFLDVTKSDLFFARGLMIVEGDAEALLLPTVAELLGCPLTAAGVSIINVGSVGLFRYSKIFQRAAGPPVPVQVACLADRDIPPDAAKDMFKKPRKTEGDYSKEEIAGRLAKATELDGGPVKTFVSPCWTLEHDLVIGGLGPEVHQAIRLAVKSRNVQRSLTDKERADLCTEAQREYGDWLTSGKAGAVLACLVYEPLFDGAASKAETAQFLARILNSRFKDKASELRSKLPHYLIEAIEYATSSTSSTTATPGNSTGPAASATSTGTAAPGNH